MVDKEKERSFNQGKGNSAKRDNSFNKALRYSLLLLKYRARTENEICQRLKEKGWGNPEIIKVITWLEDNKFLNDKNFVNLFIESSLNKGWGPKRVSVYLNKFGIAFDFIKNINEQDDSFIKVLRENIKKKISAYSNQKCEIGKKKILDRIFRSMIAKGFDAEVVLREINSLEECCFEDK